MFTDTKGCICLDIDGTLTADPYSIPKEVVSYLQKLSLHGWTFVFVTGRTFSFASRILDFLDFPFFFGVQNGADLLWMPKKTLVSRSYLSGEFIERLEKKYEVWEEDCIVYAGYELGDFCYYRPKCFSDQMREHLEVVMALSPEPWQEVESFDFLIDRKFPLVKCFGDMRLMQQIYSELKEDPTIHISYIRDPLSKKDVYINLITSKTASKGHVLQEIRKKLPDRVPFIAAGDDRNDVSMLQAADIAIVMETAPKEMLTLGHIQAKSAERLGIIEALEKATKVSYGN